MFESRILRWGRIAASALAITSATPALARNGLTLDAAALSVSEGESFTLQLAMDFADRSVGGGVHLEYDPAVVRLSGISFAPGLRDDPDLRCPGDAAAPAAVACPDPGLMSFGSIDGLQGAHPVAWLEFEALGPGSSPIRLRVAEPFSDPLGAPMAIEAGASLVQVSAGNASDRDGDGWSDVLDTCPDWPDPDQKDSDQDGRGNACECGDQNGDGELDVTDIVAINGAIFGSQARSALCDANGDGLCDVSDLVAVNRGIFGAPTWCSRYPQP